MSTVRAGIYCRISDDRAGGGLGVDRQRLDCVRLANRLGWRVADVFIDNDISAYSGKRRPEYERLHAEIVSGRIDAVVTWHPDRLNRSPVELERLIDLLDRYSVSVQTVTAGAFDLSTPTGRAVARTVGAWARYESEHKGERIKAQKLQRAKAGLTNGGRFRPYGYEEDKLTVKPTEATVLREMMRRLLDGEALVELAAALNGRGVCTTMGGRWTSAHLGDLLCSSRLAGWRDLPSKTTDTRNVHRQFLAKAVWPAIVSKADVTRARALLGDDTLRPGSTSRWLLSGILTCGICHSPISSSYADLPRRRYACTANSSRPRCGHVSITWPVEGDVVGRLHDAVKDGLLARVAAAAEPFAVHHHVTARAAQQMHRMSRDRDHTELTESEWRRQYNRIKFDSATDRATVTALGEVDLAAILRAPSRFAATWQAMPMRARRATMRLLTASVILTPSAVTGQSRADKRRDRVAITWRA